MAVVMPAVAMVVFAERMCGLVALAPVERVRLARVRATMPTPVLVQLMWLVVLAPAPVADCA